MTPADPATPTPADARLREAAQHLLDVGEFCRTDDTESALRRLKATLADAASAVASEMERLHTLAKANNGLARRYAEQIQRLRGASVLALEALEEAVSLIQEAKGHDGPEGGFVTDHLDFAENWLDKVRAALTAEIAEGAVGAGNARVALDRLNERFGPNNTSGVHAILIHDDLPEWFDLESWDGWQFKPGESALHWADGAGLVMRAPLGGKWSFTALGHAVRALLSPATPVGAIAEDR